MGRGQHGEGIGADLVGGVAAGGDSVGTHDHHRDPAGCQQVAGRRINQHRDRDAPLHEFPGSEPGALEERPGLVGKHGEPSPRVPRRRDHRQGGARAAGRQGAGVAVGEHVTGGEHASPVLADRQAEFAVFIVDRLCRMKQGCRECFRGRILRQRVDHSDTPLNCPAEVHGGRPGGGEPFAPGEHVGPSRVGREPRADGLARGNSQPVAAGDADGRRPADPQACDRLHDRIYVMAGEPLKPARQERLVEDLEVAGRVTDPAERHRGLSPFPCFTHGLNGSQGRPKAAATAGCTSDPANTLTAERIGGLRRAAAATPSSARRITYGSVALHSA